MKTDNGTHNSVIGKVSEYIARSGEAELPAEVIKKAKHHILDSLAAMVSGLKLKPGQLAKKYVRSQAGVKEAQVVGSRIVVPAINAALANGMMAHADETDDVHLKSVGNHVKSVCHPGCAAVPAALAIAEQAGADGMRFLKGVVVGYDIGCRIFQAIGIDFHVLQKSHFSTHGIGANFCAATAAAAVSGLKGDLIRYVLSYVANQTSGQHYWMRDEEHVEKAFVFGGMPARNGVTATILVQAGFTGVWDAFSGDHNFFEPFNSDSRPELLAEGLGTHYEIMYTTIKKLPVGGPLISPLDGLLLLIEKYGIRATDVESITASIPESFSRPVGDDRNMPVVNLQHLLAVALLDGSMNFEKAHSYDRMRDPSVLEVRKRIKWIKDPELFPWQSVVEVATKDGNKFRERIEKLHGTPENPMTTEDVEKKCRDLLTPVLGKDRSQALIDKIWNLEQVRNMRELRFLLST